MDLNTSLDVISERMHTSDGLNASSSLADICADPTSSRFRVRDRGKMEVAENPGLIEDRLPMDDNKFEFGCQGCREQIPRAHSNIVYMAIGKQRLQFCCVVCVSTWATQVCERRTPRGQDRIRGRTSAPLVIEDKCVVCCDAGDDVRVVRAERAEDARDRKPNKQGRRRTSTR